MKDMNTGLIFITNITDVEPTLIQELCILDNLKNQIDEAGVSSSVDRTTMAIVGSEDGYVGGSYLATVSIDPTGLRGEEILRSFSAIMGDEPVIIQEVHPGSYFIGIKPGVAIASKTIKTIEEAVKRTSTNYEIPYVLESILVMLNVVDEAEYVSPTTTTAREASINRMINEAPEDTGTTQPKGQVSLGDIDIETIITKVVERLLENSDGVFAKFKEVADRADSIEKSILEKVLTRIPQRIQEEENNTSEENVPSYAGIESAGVPETMSELWNNPDVSLESENTQPQSVIYNKLSLESLIKDNQILSDDALFDIALEHSNELTSDELENLASFDMYEYITKGVEVPLTPRETARRKIELDLY